MQIPHLKNQVKSLSENSRIDECQNYINQVYPELSIRWAKIYGKRWAFIKGNPTRLSLNPEKYQLNTKLGIILDNPEVISTEQKKELLALLKECFMINPDKILNILRSEDENELENLLEYAAFIRKNTIGNTVYLRGLIEFSNICSLDCFYCGLRSSNRNIVRYKLSKEEIISLALFAHEQGFQSLALQSGEIKTDAQINWLAEVIAAIKKATDLGITLSIGELDYYQYQKLYEAGAHRYLLRIETSNPHLFARIHPPGQSLAKRIEALHYLKEIGYQVGTGIMIGLPDQTCEDLFSDLDFFIKMDIDMLGMGPYIPHPDTPLALQQNNIKIEPYTATLKMISLSRILMPDINIVASTALQTIHPEGLKNGLKAGANIVMPVLTPEEKRLNYALYAGKKYTPFTELLGKIKSSGFEVGLWKYGDSPHYFRRKLHYNNALGGDKNAGNPAG